jgi:hypothetical protein
MKIVTNSSQITTCDHFGAFGDIKTTSLMTTSLLVPVQPPKAPMIKKMVEPIGKRKLAWETTATTTIGAQHVHEFFSNLNTKQ